ncbi:MAG: hypothetical protein ACPGSI_16875 [Pikeienuella sp.]
MIRFHDNMSGRADRFQVLGERCSGTNYLHHLIIRNLPELQVSSEYHWKHGFIDRRTAASPGLLTLVIYRHPLRWLHAVHNHPWELSASMKGIPFDAFIRCPWRAAWDHGGREEPIQSDMQPHTMTPFANALRLRNAKVKWLEGLAEMPGNIAFIRYEDLNRHPRACIETLANHAGLAPIEHFVPVPAYKGDRNRAYRPRPQATTSATDMAFINSELDLAQEQELGYLPEHPPQHDGLPWWDKRVIHARLRSLIRA